MTDLIVSFLRFLSKPNRLVRSEESWQDQLLEVCKLFLFIFAVVIFIAAPLMHFIGADELPNKLSELTDLGIDNIFLRNMLIFLLAVILAPVAEELVFRFPLKYRRGALFLGSLFLCMLVYGLLLNFPLDPSQASYITIGFGIACMVFILLNNKSDQTLSRSANRLFPYIFYTTAILFAFAHILNYNLPAEKWFLSPILVLPQFLLGLVLGFVRIKYGLWASILVHAMNNFIPFLAIVFMPEM